MQIRNILWNWFGFIFHLKKGHFHDFPISNEKSCWISIAMKQDFIWGVREELPKKNLYFKVKSKSNPTSEGVIYCISSCIQKSENPVKIFWKCFRFVHTSFIYDRCTYNKRGKSWLLGDMKLRLFKYWFYPVNVKKPSLFLLCYYCANLYNKLAKLTLHAFISINIWLC